MPAKSKAQQRFFGMVRAAQKGELKNPSKAVKKAAGSMSKKSVKDFASTKSKKLPKKIKESFSKKLTRILENVEPNNINESADIPTGVNVIPTRDGTNKFIIYSDGMDKMLAGPFDTKQEAEAELKKIPHK